MAEKTIALGTIVKCDSDDDDTFEVVGQIRSATPPGRTRERVAEDDLSDTLRTEAMGIEQASDFEFMQLWEPGDTEHEKMDTLFGSKDIVSWQCIYPVSTPVTDEFTGQVAALEPEQLVANNLIGRKVTVHRKSAITRT